MALIKSLKNIGSSYNLIKFNKEAFYYTLYTSL